MTQPVSASSQASSLHPAQIVAISILVSLAIASIAIGIAAVQAKPGLSPQWLCNIGTTEGWKMIGVGAVLALMPFIVITPRLIQLYRNSKPAKSQPAANSPSPLSAPRPLKILTLPEYYHPRAPRDKFPTILEIYCHNPADEVRGAPGPGAVSYLESDMTFSQLATQMQKEGTHLPQNYYFAVRHYDSATKSWPWMRVENEDKVSTWMPIGYTWLLDPSWPESTFTTVGRVRGSALPSMF